MNTTTVIFPDATEIPMTKFEVGEIYPGEPLSAAEGTQYNIHGQYHELRIYLSRPTAQEIEFVRFGKAEFGFARRGEAIYLLYRFGAMSWADAPYCWHLSREARPDNCPVASELPTAESRFYIHVHLIDIASQKLKALRALSFSPKFSVALRDAIEEQAASPWQGRDFYERDVADTYKRFTTQRLLQHAKARCIGGA